MAQRPVRTYSIDVYRDEFNEGNEDDGVWWSADAGFTDDDSVGYDYESREGLAELLVEVVEDTRARWSVRYDLRLEWALFGASGSLADIAAGVGFALPDRLDGP